MSVCGVLNIDKPTGLTSREVVDQIQRIVRPSKVGHAGTLDPLATGVLIVCVGHATRLIELIQSGRKCYRARFELGRHSDTDDITGNVTLGGDWKPISKDQLQCALAGFVGRIQQVPPQYSAVHVDGQRAYKLARKGKSFELTAKTVDVYSIRIIEVRMPEIEVEIECGSGTYIRSIGRDLGQKLGCGAVMTSLQRTSVSHFDIADAIRVESVEADTIGQHLLPALSAVQDLPRRQLTEDETVTVRCGKSLAVTAESQSHERRIVLVDPAGQMLGMAEFQIEEQRLQPRIIFPAET
jgi:tRNA pseudouridine55 synthase